MASHRSKNKTVNVVYYCISTYYLDRIDKFLLKNSGQQCPLLLCRQFLKFVSLCLEKFGCILFNHLNLDRNRNLFHLLLVNLWERLLHFFDMRSQIQLPSGEQLDCFVGNLGRGGMSLDWKRQHGQILQICIYKVLTYWAQMHLSERVNRIFHVNSWQSLGHQQPVQHHRNLKDYQDIISTKMLLIYQ